MSKELLVELDKFILLYDNEKQDIDSLKKEDVLTYLYSFQKELTEWIEEEEWKQLIKMM